MQTLKLNATQLPASKLSLPLRADVYVCDKCGRDVTKHLHRGRAHVTPPLGPPRYTCVCGEQYATGVMEWDQMSPLERRHRLFQIALYGTISGIPSAGFLLLLRATWVHVNGILFALSVVAEVPGILFLVLFTSAGIEAMDILQSMWRTRVAARWRN